MLHTVPPAGAAEREMTQSMAAVASHADRHPVSSIAEEVTAQAIQGLRARVQTSWAFDNLDV